VSAGAVLDANVIWGAPLRDTLLWAAWYGLFRPVWSEEILAEMVRTLKQLRAGLDPAAIDRTAARMQQAFPTAMVAGYQHLIPRLTNDPEDRHVLAAAVQSGATVIVTWNVDDFPTRACAPYGIEVQTPDEFLSRLWQEDMTGMVAAITTQADNLKRPARTPREVLDKLGDIVPGFARLAKDSGLI
jgi:predicted nucleic acid-binding protein